MIRISREEMLMRIAHTAAMRGTCGRLSVGAIIARDSRPISLGYVGAPAHEPHCDENDCDMTKPCTRTVHAEINALRFAVEWNIQIVGADMFVTNSPCIECAKAIYGSGVRRVYYDKPYRLTDGIDYLRGLGVSVHQVHINQNAWAI